MSKFTVEEFGIIDPAVSAFVDEESSNAARWFVDNIENCGDDLFLLTLKGHLLIEEGMNNLLRELLPNGTEVIDSSREGSFSRKCTLLKSLLSHDYEGFYDLVESIKTLGKARNHLAHDIESKNLEKKLRNFLTTKEIRKKLSKISEDVELRELVDTSGDLSEQLKAALLICFVTLTTYRDTFRKLRLSGIPIKPWSRSDDPILK